MNVFVTGATGYIGAAVVKALVRAGHEVTGMTRSEEKIPAIERLGAKGHVGNIKAPASYTEVAMAHDTLVHAAFEMGEETVSADRTAINTLLRAARTAGGERHIVFTSGVWVLGNTHGQTVDETSPLDPIPPVAWRPDHEASVLTGATDRIVTGVIRPGVVYGGGTGILAGYFKAADEGAPVRIVGDGANCWAMVHVDDLADLYRRVIERRAGGVFHATDGSALTVRTIAEAIAKSAGKGSRVETWAVEEARETLGGFVDGLAIDQIVASPRSERELGWLPRYRSFVRNARDMYDEWAQGQG